MLLREKFGFVLFVGHFDQNGMIFLQVEKPL